MADTAQERHPDKECSDCSNIGTVIRHWGPLVPPGVVGDFCAKCWSLRDKAGQAGETPKPLGYRKNVAVS